MAMGLDRLVAKFQPRSPKDPRAVLRCRPRRCDAVEEELQPDGSVQLRAPLNKNSRGLQAMIARAAKAPVKKTFELEAVGTFVWSLCDGTLSLETMAERLRVQFKMNRLEAEAALVAFVQTLGRKGLITLLPPEPKRPKGAKRGR